MGEGLRETCLRWVGHLDLSNMGSNGAGEEKFSYAG